ncbi:MAG: hypothetical protein HQL92_02445 [Magnetococcales bacterium]|nr:hypothetical protein [Magnetococcales bacterium]
MSFPTSIAAFAQLVKSVDPVVAYGMFTKGAQALFGLINLLFITHFFSSEMQGYYYAFSSLLALQVFAELGLYLVIISLASHEWSRLELDASGRVIGDSASKSRLSCLVIFVLRWYSVISVVFLIAAGSAGFYFLSQSGSSAVNWKVPWIVAVILASVQLWLMPFLSVVEGCNQLERLNRFRFKQAMIEGVATWILFLSGVGLWVMVGSLVVRSTSTIYFLSFAFGRFFLSLYHTDRHERISWKHTIWPMQWRLSLQGVVNYFANSLFVPVMFHYHGSATAGQMGMTLQLVTTLHTLAIVWVQAKAPLFGILISDGKFDELDRVWKKSAIMAFTQSLVTSVGLFFAVLIVKDYQPEIGARLLDPLILGVFLIAHLLLQITNYQSYYLRAHAREPFLILGTVGASAIGIGVFLFGRYYGPMGVSLSYLSIVMLFIVPFSCYIMIKRKADWQQRG